MGLLLNRRREMGGEALPYDAQIAYIQSSGTQYIDTGVNFQTGIKMSLGITFVTATSGQAYFGGQTGGGGNSNQLSNDAGYMNVGFNGNTRLSTTIVANSYHDIEYSSIFGTCYLKDNGTTLFTKSNSSNYADMTMPLFALKTGANSYVLYASMKLHYCKIWNNSGILVRDYIPVRVGQVGYLYDKVTGNFYGNSGSGSFTLGSDV